MIFTLKTSNPSTGIFYAIFGLALPYFALLGLNVATGSIIVIKRKNLVRRSSMSPNLTSSGRRRDEVKATITILVMILVFTLTTLPAMVAVTIYNGTEHKAKGDATVRSVWCLFTCPAAQLSHYRLDSISDHIQHSDTASRQQQRVELYNLQLEVKLLRD